VNPLSSPELQQTLKGVFRLVAPEIALIGTACVIFLFGCAYNRRWLWFLVSLSGVCLAMILAGAVKTATPPVISAAPIVPDAVAAFVRWFALLAALVLLFISWAEASNGIAAE
jgi:NADH-quinone oxidoreductase subunit N